MEIVALMMVRNEADILRINVLHHLARESTVFSSLIMVRPTAPNGYSRSSPVGAGSAGPATMGRIARRRSPPRWRMRRSTVEPIGLCRLTLTSSGTLRAVTSDGSWLKRPLERSRCKS